MTDKNLFIGIAGISGSGKTSISKYFRDNMTGGNAEILSLDHYYRDLSHVHPAERARFNFDVPEAFDWEFVKRSLMSLKRGECCERPTYDFQRHIRLSRTKTLRPAKVVIMEGLYSLYWEDIRKLFHTTAFVNIDNDEALNRRIKRDQEERGRSQEQVINQYLRQVRPMQWKYLLPTSVFADLTLDGRKPLTQSCQTILDHINQRSSISRHAQPFPQTA